MKLAGNFLITAVIEGLAESFALVRKAGLDANLFHEILTNSLFNAPIYKTYGALINSQKFEPAGFKLPLGLKDNRLLLAAAEENAVPCRWRASSATAFSPGWPRAWVNRIGRRFRKFPLRKQACEIAFWVDIEANKW